MQLNWTRKKRRLTLSGCSLYIQNELSRDREPQKLRPQKSAAKVRIQANKTQRSGPQKRPERLFDPTPEHRKSVY